LVVGPGSGVGVGVGLAVGSGQPVIGTFTTALLLPWFAVGSLEALTVDVFLTRGHVATGAVTLKLTDTCAPTATVPNAHCRLFGSEPNTFHPQVPAEAGFHVRLEKSTSTSGSTELSTAATPEAAWVPALRMVMR
jgi:hypothetical protein